MTINPKKESNRTKSGRDSSAELAPVLFPWSHGRHDLLWATRCDQAHKGLPSREAYPDLRFYFIA